MHRRGSAGFDFREGFLLDSGYHHIETAGARGVKHKQRKAAIAGDEADAVRHIAPVYRQPQLATGDRQLAAGNWQPAS